MGCVAVARSHGVPKGAPCLRQPAKDQLWKAKSQSSTHGFMFGGPVKAVVAVWIIGRGQQCMSMMLPPAREYRTAAEERYCNGQILERCFAAVSIDAKRRPRSFA